MTLGRASLIVPALALVLAACTPPPAEKPPFIRLTTNQPASVVIGQADFETTSEADTSRNFESPYGRPLILDGVLYLPDYAADRVMGYLAVPTGNDAAADSVLGRDGFDDVVSSPISAQRMDGPQSIATDGTRLFVLDYSSSRILVYNEPPTTTFAAADYVIGQPDFASDTYACTDTNFSNPEGMFVNSNKLIVADSNNNRVLIWNTIPTDSSTPADIVLGQGGFTTCAANDDAQTGVHLPEPTARTMDYPTEVWTDGKILMVADVENHRVLIWKTFPTANFVPADIVLGQPNMTSNTSAVGPSSLDYPRSLYSNGTQLFVTDTDNNRVLVWNSLPTVTAQPADVVLGQADMNSSDYNGGSASVTANGLFYPTGVFALGDLLLVSDNGNERYLIYEGVTAP